MGAPAPGARRTRRRYPCGRILDLDPLLRDPGVRRLPAARVYGQSKYRIRQYGKSDPVFLERKFRTGRLLAKRRTTVPASDLLRLESDRPDPDWEGFWFHRRIVLRRLRPLLQLSYDRIAREGTSYTGPVRLTIDANLAALPMPDRAFLPGIGLPFLEGFSIVEIKYRMTVPAVFKRLIETFGLEVQNISKFRAGLRSLDYPLPTDPDEQYRERRLPWVAIPPGSIGTERLFT